ncbi:putative set domain-containing protein [Neofusicoccum parvum UCRNP2]|uniref:Putative set domain-containing protein n=1 Tax=Botryosphaeria parva (strain UCR-NP2) TaxID=1287680 RepID=R1GV82_BOTPV|nr:putative set domain-containing protein [Neofusicoccum parvum UCRNP2]
MIIARGRSEAWLKLPVAALKPWADLNDVTFNAITVGPLPGFEQRGSTVIAAEDLSAGNAEPLMIIPRDLVLSQEAVRLHAKSDQHLREVLDALAEFGRPSLFAVSRDHRLTGSGVCEMLFSYGFIEDNMTSARELFLDLEIPNDDPLKRAKLHVNTSAPGFRVFDADDAGATAGSTSWQSDFIWLVIVNEEDGLEFEVAQTTDGGRELRVYWNGSVLEEPDKLKDVLKAHPMWDVYRLRAVSLIQDRVETQLRLLYGTEDEVKAARRGEFTGIRENVWSLATRLRDLEKDLLERAYGSLEEEKERLVETETVQQYLQAMAQQEPEEDFT